MSTFTTLETFWQDTRFGMRSLRRDAGTTSIIVLTLMLGIGANTVLFSAIHAVLLNPLPYRNPQDLVFIAEHHPGMDSVRPADFLDWRSQTRTLQPAAAFAPGTMTLRGRTEDIEVPAVVTLGSLLDVLGVSPAIGRNFLPEEVEPGAGGSSRRVALVSNRFFREYFGADPAALGKTFVLNNAPVALVGVLPAEFRFAPPGFGSAQKETDVIVNLPLTVAQVARRTGGALQVIARLKPGVKVETARAEIETIRASSAARYPEANRTELRMIPLRDRILGSSQLAFLVLWAAVAFVLLAACLNVSNLLLSRGAARGRETAIRTALGSGRGRLIRQLLTESVLLAFAGGAAGVLLALWGIRLMVNLNPIDIPRLRDATMNWNVLLFSVTVCALTGLLAGLAPAVTGSRSNLCEMLKSAGRAAAFSKGHRHMQGLLVVSQLAVALVLTSGAGLMLKSLWVMRSENRAFRPDLVVTTTVNARLTAHPDEYLEDLVARFESLPGVRAAAASSMAGIPLRIAGLPAPSLNQNLSVLRVTPHYAVAAGLRVLAGRWLGEYDRKGSPNVAVVNEAMARTYSQLYPNGAPLLGAQIDEGGRIATVIGVVSAFQARLDVDPEPEMFVPCQQWLLNGITTYLVRSAAEPAGLANAIQRVIGRTTSVSMKRPVILQDELSEAIAPRRFQAAILILFAALALVLACVGAYGVLSHAVAERTPEIGVRMALGASGSAVSCMVLRGAARLAVTGVAAGLVASVALTRFMSSLLYGVRPNDAWTYLIVCSLLILVAGGAAWLPARRATRVDPIVALRFE